MDTWHGGTRQNGAVDISAAELATRAAERAGRLARQMRGRAVGVEAARRSTVARPALQRAAWLGPGSALWGQA